MFEKQSVRGVIPHRVQGRSDIMPIMPLQDANKWIFAIFF